MKKRAGAPWASQSHGRGDPTATGADPSPAASLLRAALLPTTIVGLLAVALSLVDSPRAAAGALLGALLAAVACSIPAAVLLLAGKWSPPAVMGLAMGAYLVLVVIFGFIYLGLARADWLSRPHLGWTLMVASAVTIAWQVRAAGRLRVLAYGSPVGAATATEPPTENG